MRDVRFSIEGEEERAYDDLYKKGHTHREIYNVGLKALEERELEIALKLQIENSK